MKLQQSPWAKDASVSSLLNLANAISRVVFYAVILFLPTQLGKHFWPSFSFVLGTRVDYLSPTLYLTDILLVMLFVFSIRKKKTVVHPLFSISCLLFSIGIFFSQNPLAGWYMLGKFIELSFLVWYVAHEQFDSLWVSFFLLCGLVFESALAVAQFIHQGSVGGVFYLLGERAFSGDTPGIANAAINGTLLLRPYGTFSHPNMLAGYAVVTMLLIAALLAGRKTLVSFVVLSAAVFVGTVGLAVSLSRVGIVTWIGCVSALAFFRKAIGKLALLGGLVSLSAGVVALVFFPAIVFRFVASPFGESFTERAVLAKDAVTLFLLHPIFGVGLGNFINALPSVEPNGVILQPVHNVFLLFAAETGVVGLLLCVAAYTLLVKKLALLFAKKSLLKKVLILLPVVAMCCIGFFDHYFLTLQQGQLLSALALGFVIRETRGAFGTIQE